MKGLTGWLIVAVLVGVPWFAFDSPFGAVTVYIAFCPQEFRQGYDGCTKGEEVGNPTTYNAIVDAQTVVYWTQDTKPRRLRVCAVRDQKNWSCELGDTPAPAAGPPPLEWSMVDGRFIDASMLPGMQPIFYQVPKWKYYLIWLRQKG
jgi:hypothetical protein